MMTKIEDLNDTWVRNRRRLTFHLTTTDGGVEQNIASQAVAAGAWHFIAVASAQNSPVLLFVDGQATRTPDPIVGTIYQSIWAMYQPFEGDVDELNMTFHSYTEQELLNEYCPL
jgi:hypothetical protein